MGADFCFAILPICNMTPERIAQARSIIADDEEFEVSKEDILGYLDTYCAGAGSDIDGYNGLRTVSHLHLHGLVYFITGGMSWGDAPTDEYTEFNLLDSQIGDLLEKWAGEDLTAEREAIKNPPVEIAST
ncbi:MAG: hypothetical protein H2169_06610 [Opitutus sp.]|nr:hypothetical protein [Opitutus sp.]